MVVLMSTHHHRRHNHCHRHHADLSLPCALRRRPKHICSRHRNTRSCHRRPSRMRRCRSFPSPVVARVSQHRSPHWFCALPSMSLLPPMFEVLLTIDVTVNCPEASHHLLPSPRIMYFTHLPFRAPRAPSNDRFSDLHISKLK